MTLTLAQKATIQKVITALDVGSAGRASVDQETADRLAEIFQHSCDWEAADHKGSFRDALRDSPVSTLLKIALCVAA